MSTGLLQVIKQAAVDVMENSQLCDLRLGTVSSVSPLKVRINNQLVIPQSLLIVPQHLTKYQIMLNDESVTINNSLKIGDKVALLKSQGGKSYFILDRI